MKLLAFTFATSTSTRNRDFYVSGAEIKVLITDNPGNEF